MSRSRRKTSFNGITTAASDKPFKVDEHRAERHAVRATIKHSLDGDDRALYSKVYGDPWKAPKDGKQMDRSRLEIDAEMTSRAASAGGQNQSITIYKEIYSPIFNSLRVNWYDFNVNLAGVEL
jgi:hypothetical protein